MEKIEYEKKVYEFVEVKDIPVCITNDIENIQRCEGCCLLNSYNTSKRNNNINIVEGFLVTYFEGGEIDCVGHVWNEKDGCYFDVTIGLKKHDKKIKANEYFIAMKYGIGAIETKETPKIGHNMYDLHSVETSIIFKTGVKSIENDVRKSLNKPPPASPSLSYTGAC